MKPASRVVAGSENQVPDVDLQDHILAAAEARGATSGPDRLRVPVAYAVLFSFIRSGARVTDCGLP
jgi:hypothetical protein